jgi:hypothetical protein
MRLAATWVQFACDWWPLGYTLLQLAASPINFLHATGGHSGKKILILAARRTLFLYHLANCFNLFFKN